MRPPLLLLAALMLLSGSINTISTKIQDNVVVGTDAAGKEIMFKHPVVQTFFMFAGEALCLIPFFIGQAFSGPGSETTPGIQPKSALFRRTALAFTLPALCDAGATTLLNLGLYYTYASVFQMLRGTLVIFAGLLTIVLLRRRLHSHNWLGMVLISAGAALVGASSIIYEKEDGGGGSAPNPLLGNLLVAIAQLLNATQFIVEEKFLRQIQPPVLLAVGSEGAVGLALCAAALPLLTFLPGPGGAPIDDIAAGFRAIAANATLTWTTLITVLSIAAFNFCGVSVTKRLSGASRAAIDACRTAIIWLFCLRAGWEKFHFMQLVGFGVLVSGTSVYNDILRACLPTPELSRQRESGDEEEPLLSESESEGSEGSYSGVPSGEQQRMGEEGTAPHSAGRPPLPRKPSRPMSAGAVKSTFSMARSITILPSALSPHSLASVPSDFNLLGDSFEASVPDDGLSLLVDDGEESEGSEGLGRHSPLNTIRTKLPRRD